MQIPNNEIKMVPTSGFDDVGKVFSWKNQIYRGIYASYADFYKEIFSSPLGEDLVNLGLIPTQVVPYHLDGFEIILEHKTVPFISYPIEWCSAMLKDAALLTCDIQSRLLKSGYTLKDAHPYNILFDCSEPKFIDVGSIALKSKNNLDHFLREFRNDFVYNLLLKYAGLSEIVHATQLTYLGLPDKLNIHRFFFYRMLFHRIPIRKWFYHLQQDRKIDNVWQRSPIAGVEQLRAEIGNIPINSGKTRRTYLPSRTELYYSKVVMSAKMTAIDELLSTLRPRSVFNVYSNNGLYSNIAAKAGARVIDCDLDDSILNDLYHRAKEKSLNILPVRLDICFPTVAYGPWGMCEAAQKRFKCELVMMLNIVPHLVQNCHRTLEDISFYLSSFTEKWVLAEFVGSKDDHFKSWVELQRPEYNLNSFIVALEKYFAEVSVFRQIDNEKWLIFCTRK